MYLSATLARRWSCIKSRSVTRCAEVSLYKVRGEGGSGLGGLDSLTTRCGVGAAFCFATGGGVGGGASKAACCRSSSTGTGMGSTFTFRRGARSLLPAGRPLFDVGTGASVDPCAFFGTIVSDFSRVVSDFSDFSGILAELSGIVASASAIFELEKHFSVNSQSKGNIRNDVQDVVVPIPELEGQTLRR